MTKLKELCNRIQDVSISAGILEGATEFVKDNADDSISSGSKNLCDILWLLQQTAKRISDEMSDIEIMANSIEGRYAEQISRKR